MSQKTPFTVKDSRRVDEKGQRRTPLEIAGKRPLDFKILRDALDTAFRYYRAQLEHMPGQRWPKSGEMSGLLFGFVVSTQQLYAAAILLMADNRPKPLVMPAGVVARALVEGLGNLMAILDAPDTAPPLFLRDDFRNTALRAHYVKQRFGSSSNHEREERKLAEYGRAMQLSAAEMANAEKALKEWPTPRRLLKRLRGERHDVFDEVYQFWYRSLSALAHHRLSALQAAVFTEEPQSNEETVVMVKSVTATLAVLVVLCVLSEIEAFCSFQPNASVRAGWEQVRWTHDIIQAVYDKRYRRLLNMDTVGA
jgi:hypothetical protein